MSFPCTEDLEMFLCRKRPLNRTGISCLFLKRNSLCFVSLRVSSSKSQDNSSDSTEGGEKERENSPRRTRGGKGGGAGLGGRRKLRVFKEKVCIPLISKGAV